MEIKITKSKFYFFCFFLIGLLISVTATFYLPEKYYYDTVTIIKDKYKEIGFFGSYAFAILFYKITFLKYLPFFLIALIQFPISYYILYKIGIPNNFHLLNLKNIIIYLAILLLGLYMSMPTKEFITILMFSPLPLIFQSNLNNFKKITICLLLFVLFSFFRSYYLLIPIFAIGMYFLSFIKFHHKTFSVITSGIFIAIFLSLNHGLIRGKFLSQMSREDYYLGVAQNYDVNSAIISPIPQNTWYGEFFGILYGFISVNIPFIELVKRLLSPQVLIFIVWELFLFYTLIVRFSKVLKSPKDNIVEHWVLLILFSYFIVQGIFEPDLGTSIRHKIGFLPLIYFALYYDYFKKSIQ